MDLNSPAIREDLQKYPHIPDKYTKHDERYDPNNYISIQTMVNYDPTFEEKYFDKLAKNGWVSLRNVSDIFLYPKGRLFKYRLNGNSLSKAPEGTFRSGGWLIGKNYSDPENNDKYILYKAYNGVVFSLQISDLQEVYIQSPKKEISVFKKPGKITRFPVYLEHFDTKVPVVVYYAEDSYKKFRFENSIKYKKALASGKWDWSTAFNYNFDEN